MRPNRGLLPLPLSAHVRLPGGDDPERVHPPAADDGGEFSGYYIAATEREVPECFEAYQVPAGTWAVFPWEGPIPDAMQELQQRIVSKWLPGSGCEYAPAPDIEVYLPGSTPERGKGEVWLPVVRK